MIVLLLSIVRILDFADSRVYCQDHNATPWTPLGFTCPVTCNVIKNVVEKLRLDVAKRLIKSEVQVKILNKLGCLSQKMPTLNISGTNIKQNLQCNKAASDSYTINSDISSEVFYNGDISDEKPVIKDIERTKDEVTSTVSTPESLDDTDLRKYEKILQNDEFIQELKSVWGNRRRAGGICATLAKKLQHRPSLLDKMARAKCGRRTANSEESLLRTFTDLLNKYTNTSHVFTMDMTSMFFEKLVGSGYLHDGPLDTRNLVTLISNALANPTAHDSITTLYKSRVSVTLKSRHCATLRAPGCYCRVGWVESGGQCVAPQDCVTKDFSKYLENVHLV